MIHLTAYQKVEAYLKILKEEDKKTEQAAIELYGIQMQLELDIEMLESIENADLEETLKQLNLVIDKIQPTADNLVLNDENTPKTPLEKLFNEL